MSVFLKNETLGQVMVQSKFRSLGVVVLGSWCVFEGEKGSEQMLVYLQLLTLAVQL